MNSCYYNQSLDSVISNGCDLRTAFSQVINYFDPNRNKNEKTRVLDSTLSYIWTEQDLNRFIIDKTNNLNGQVRDVFYDIITYEPSKNSLFEQESFNACLIFKEILSKNGIIIVKMNDFKEKGVPKLKGSFEIWDIFSKNNFFLYDNIIYKYNKTLNHLNVFDRSEIIHLYFMIFKKNKP